MYAYTHHKSVAVMYSSSLVYILFACVCVCLPCMLAVRLRDTNIVGNRSGVEAVTSICADICVRYVVHV